MGKKKASKSRKLRPMLEQAISQGEVYCRPYISRAIDIEGNLIEGPEYESYSVMFGSDIPPYKCRDDDVHVCVAVYSNGDIRYHFMNNRNHMLDREHSAWFVDQLEQIITLHKMGAYESEYKDIKVVDYHFLRKPGYYKSKRS